jgi:hypothetical protein
MPMPPLHICGDHMQQNWRVLREHWEITRGSWKDVDRDQFEREYIREFEDTVGKYLTRLTVLADTVARARREVP